jgi:hypothetical protein
VVLPAADAYLQAIQHPSVAFADPELRQVRPEVGPLGLPRAISGNSAVVFPVRGVGGRSGVRCFTRLPPDLARRYEAISRHLAAHPLPYLVAFRFLPQGIRVGPEWFPVVHMAWVQGEHLDRFVAHHLRDPGALQALADAWARMLADLEGAGIAHGDLQHGNVLVRGGLPVLVDYDGMFVPELRGLPAPELGHPSYQHPARTPRDFDLGLDRFAGWVVWVTLLALAEEPRLWEELRGGEEGLLFHRRDFEDPDGSPVFARLLRMAGVGPAARLLAEAARAGPDRLPLPGRSPEAVVPQAAPAEVGATRAWWEDHRTSSPMLPFWVWEYQPPPLPSEPPPSTPPPQPEVLRLDGRLRREVWLRWLTGMLLPGLAGGLVASGAVRALLEATPFPSLPALVGGFAALAAIWYHALERWERRQLAAIPLWGERASVLAELGRWRGRESALRREMERLLAERATGLHQAAELARQAEERVRRAEEAARRTEAETAAEARRHAQDLQDRRRAAEEQADAERRRLQGEALEALLRQAELLPLLHDSRGRPYTWAQALPHHGVVTAYDLVGVEGAHLVLRSGQRVRIQGIGPSRALWVWAAREVLREACEKQLQQHAVPHVAAAVERVGQELERALAALDAEAQQAEAARARRVEQAWAEVARARRELPAAWRQAQAQRDEVEARFAERAAALLPELRAARDACTVHEARARQLLRLDLWTFRAAAWRGAQPIPVAPAVP